MAFVHITCRSINIARATFVTFTRTNLIKQRQPPNKLRSTWRTESTRIEIININLTYVRIDRKIWRIVFEISAFSSDCKSDILPFKRFVVFFLKRTVNIYSRNNDHRSFQNCSDIRSRHDDTCVRGWVGCTQLVITHVINYRSKWPRASLQGDNGTMEVGQWNDYRITW